MIKSLTNFFISQNSNLSFVNYQKAQVKVTCCNFKRFFSSKKTNVEEEFQEDKSFGVKNLERVDLINKHMSWPQYNRIIYPPNENGTPMKNPVSFNNIIKTRS